jgi:hypothetical protein
MIGEPGRRAGAGAADVAVEFAIDPGSGSAHAWWATRDGHREAMVLGVGWRLLADRLSPTGK